ncbi:flavin-binding monooxygenase-like protein [Coleophoma cylindrospora]|uniref:Flavin-binding monooxygenase-like protein n=1 Tax=Coleophoma cylindrospora TaxID=1849047 RepID=A0A3D8SFZ7_9HELO|nr:flavin-binding monooxygenase-like protein [Coleophoma cylindrospora]
MAPSLEIVDSASGVPGAGIQNAKNIISVASSEIPLEPSSTAFELEDHPIDEIHPVKVAVIGAGLSGITAGALIPAKVPGVNLQIFEKNPDVGGTWFENAFPGVRCDIPANVYQSTFEPNTQWSEEYAQGAEIRDYWQSVARKHNVYQYLRLSHTVESAAWDDSTAQWKLSVQNTVTNEAYEESFDVLITAIGRFNAWKLPDYPGIQEFEGHLRHSSAWDTDFDPTGKVVAVIGNGASGIQVVPNIQPLVQRLDHYARSKTWIAGSFGGEGTGRTLAPKYYAPELLKSFEDPETYLLFRKELEGKFYRRFSTLFRDTEENKKLKEEFKGLMAERLKKKPELLEHMIPDFSPNCRRLTPGPGYLEALTEDNVNYITTPIQRFTKDGIVTQDGVERKVDAVICSTGANVDGLPPFPITANGQDIRDVWKPSPYTYLGLATPSFPNLLFIQGPNGTGHSGTVPNQVETQITYISQLLRKVQQQRIKTFVPSKAAADDFSAYCDAFFPKTVFTENCSSWANGGKPGGKIHGHWPGSASHLNHVRRSPRWEDWEWSSRGKTGNRFAYFGNGWTSKEKAGDGDLTAYLKLPQEIDLRKYHEEWFEI